MKTLTEESSQVLREAVRDQVVDTVLYPFDGFSIPFDMFEWVTSQGAIEPQNPHTFELLEHPKSRRYQEVIFDAVTDPDITGWWGVELARIVVPKGEVGFLTGIDQVLNDVEGNYFPTNVAYWGSPNYVLPDVDNTRWFLKLDYYDGLIPQRFNRIQFAPAMQPGVLPGWGYPELHEIPGIWYPAHNSNANKLSLIIPGQRMLRFYFFTPPTVTYQWQVSGRLRAYTQSTYSREAQANARMIF